MHDAPMAELAKSGKGHQPPRRPVRCGLDQGTDRRSGLHSRHSVEIKQSRGIPFSKPKYRKRNLIERRIQQTQAVPSHRYPLRSKGHSLSGFRKITAERLWLRFMSQGLVVTNLAHIYDSAAARIHDDHEAIAAPASRITEVAATATARLNAPEAGVLNDPLAAVATNPAFAAHIKINFDACLGRGRGNWHHQQPERQAARCHHHPDHPLFSLRG
jgi:hypothetical protein